MDKELVKLLYEDKIKKLLEKFLEPNFEIKTDTYLNNFLSHLSGKEDKDLGKHLVQLPVFTEWLLNCITFWEDGNWLPPSDKLAFVFHIASLLAKDETHFNLLNSYNAFTRLCTATNINKLTSSPSVQLAYIKLLTAFLLHQSGMTWLISKNNWNDVLDFCLKGQTIYIVREGQQFMYQLLLSSSKHNKQFCNMVIDKIMLVFKEVQQPNNTKVLEINGEKLQGLLMPSLRLIGYILENQLKDEAFVKREYNLPQMFVKKIDVEQNFWSTILTGLKHQDLVYEINKVMILNNFFKVAIECEQPFYEYTQNQQMITFILDVFKQLVQKYDTTNILKIGYIAQQYWSNITPRLEKVLHDRDKLPIIFDLQVVVFQIFPIVAISYTYCNFNMEAATEMGSIRDEFITKIFSGWCEDTIRLTYQFRQRLEADSKNLLEIAQKAFMYLMKSGPYLKRAPAILAFQFFIYILKDMTRVMMEKPETISIFMKNTRYLITHFDGIGMFIHDYGITWQESIEITSIMSIVMKFIKVTHWPSQLIVQILKLVNMCIAKFTIPNLALLVDRTCDSTLADLGPLLVAKLHDTDWEVRDSALEVLQTISTIAHTTFPSFQTLILEHQLPLSVITMSLHDSESFVRASALKCLKEMIQVSEVWSVILNEQELPEKMLQILYNETEAIVRCEAASVLCVIYNSHLFEWPLVDSINQAMVYAATTDLHWEVKLKALSYWNSVIDNRLLHQGMIDGEFPEVTFSSEHKKIVTLTKEGIRNRLNKILVQLSECGCLGVLIASVQDECDIEVSKKAVKITRRLSELLIKYDVTFTPVSPTESTPKFLHNNYLLTSNPINLELSNDIIDEIVNSRDVHLLPNVCFDSGDNTLIKQSNPRQYKQHVPPSDFFNFIKRDLDALVNKRKNWLNNIDNLGSLLDDMLKNYDICDDTNIMDCY